MERRYFLKLAFGVAAGAAALAVSAQAAPLLPVSPQAGLMPSRAEEAKPAVVTQDDVDHLQPEQVHWGHHGHGHHWGWHRHHWHHRHWGWRRHHWHRRHWGWHHRHWGWHHRHWHHRHW